MNDNIKLDVATGRSADTKIWTNKRTTWAAFVDRLAAPYKTNETFKEFMQAGKAEQSKIKDVGGYVGGYLRGGRRNPENVIHRQLLTLDIDFAHVDFWDDFIFMFGFAAIIHSTHKHCEASPRYRLIIPLSRPASPDEYVAVSRKIAGDIGIDLFDNTTFETNRLMFWQSTPRDMDYYFREQRGPWLDVDDVLGQYVDWTDTSLWPTADKVLKELGANAKKLEDPRSKRGVIGAFCRTYGINDVIDSFLSEQYIATTDPGRFTYTKGTTAAGLIIYDDTFAYSHHGTDPCGGRLSNAFDLVRVHLFGHLDSKEGYTSQKPPSFLAMEDLALNDKEVKKTISGEAMAAAKYDFTEALAEDDALAELMGEEFESPETKKSESLADSMDWTADLEIDNKGKFLSSASNINTIFANDPRLKGAFKQNDFDGKRYVFRNLPWRRVKTMEVIKNVDYSGIRNYIETIYGITGSLKIEDTVALEFEKNTFHPIRDYLKALMWDGKPRVDKLLIDYFGAKDNVYTREAVRKFCLGAVSRVFSPGCKFDLVLVIAGPQGSKKSSFFNKLGGDWFSDTFMSVQGKDALEQIQGAWIIEMAELSGLRKAEVEAVKHFLSKQEDNFRPAYARTSETFKRQCVFAGTTNKKSFLADPTGNRRFLPIDVRLEHVKKDVFVDLPGEVSQIWAEAVTMYKSGENLFLSKAADRLANLEQIGHSDTDERLGLIEAFIKLPLPADWDKLDIYERRMYISADGMEHQGAARKIICTAEIWGECLNKAKEDMSRYNTRDINELLRGLNYLEYHATTRDFPIYGKQKYYSIIPENTK